MQSFLQQPESVERISLESKTGVYILYMYIYIFLNINYQVRILA